MDIFNVPVFIVYNIDVVNSILASSPHLPSAFQCHFQTSHLHSVNQTRNEFVYILVYLSKLQRSLLSFKVVLARKPTKSFYNTIV